MDIKKKLQEFNKRWNIKEPTDFEEEFRKFKNRIINIFNDIDDHITDKGITLFCQILGIPEEWDYNLYTDQKESKNIINALMLEDEPVKFYRLLEIIFCLPFESVSYSRYRGEITSRETLIQKLAEAIHFSNINLAMAIKGDNEIVLYPKGEKELDKKLVDEVLSFLNEKSQKHFVNALKSYQKNTKDDFVKSAESLRRGLEEFLRFRLGNQKGLRGNIKELRERLKSDNRDPMIRNIIFQIFSYLDQYFNENSKHKDGNINEAETEFLIYQVGLLMRYIHKELS